MTSEVNQWLRNLNHEEEMYALYVLCSMEDLSLDAIVEYKKEHGIVSVNQENEIGITPLHYLAANPYTESNEQKIFNTYILDLMGEIEPNEKSL